MDVVELRPGLWRWTAEHPEWEPGVHWPRTVGSVYAELPDALVVIDPLVPADEQERFWNALDRDVERAARPVHVLLTVHWHERSAAELLARYDASLWRPEQRDAELPAGVHADVIDGADWAEAVFYLAPFRALVAGDLLVADPVLRVPVSWFPTEEQDWARADLKNRLRSILDEPVELVLVAHGDPVLEGAQDALARALA
jgi:glyoxylase-like metal-dependent hydrolase (beta-lactamase superfamily II)